MEKNALIDRRFRISFIILIALIFLADVIGYLPYLSRKRVILHAPVTYLVSSPAFLAAGEAWAPGELPPVEIRARHLESGMILAYPAIRNAIKQKGVVIDELNAFTAKIELPLEGAWELEAAMRDGATGALISSPVRRIRVSASAAPRSFKAFDPGHRIAILVLLVAFVALIVRYRKPRSEAEIRAASLILGSAILLVELSYHIYWVAIGAFSATSYLMLQMCGISVLVLPFVLVMEPGRRRERLFEIVWFWGAGGAFQAYLAPVLATHPFPEPRFFTYFLEHGLLILAPVFLALTSGMRITMKSVLRALGITIAAGALVWGMDQVWRFIPPWEPANYFMIGYPPPNGSIIDLFADVFGPSPAYGIGLVLMAAALFLLLWAPFPVIGGIKALAEKIRAAKSR